MENRDLLNLNVLNKAKLVIAIYSRVSTIEQAEEGYSIAEQERLLIEYAEKNNLEVYKCYSDRGISGKNIESRPALKELLKDAEEKKFDMVITWKINRLSRKLSDVLKIVELFERNNIKFKSYSEPFETNTISGKMQFQMMALIGEYERGTIAQNVKMGMMARAREGKWCGNKVYGYDLVAVEGSDNRKRRETRLVINKDEATVIRIMFDMYLNGKGYKAITSYLNKQGYKTKKGNDFSVGSIKDMLTNPVYIGKIRYNLRQEWNEKRRRNINPDPIIVDGIHEPIIDEKTWDRVQALMETKKGKPSRIYDGEFPLTGILKCPVCGAGMVIMRTGKKRKDGTKMQYYACGAWKNKGTAVCNSNGISVEKANEYVYGKLSELLSNDKMVKAIVTNINKERRRKVAPSKKELERIDKELSKLDIKRKKIFELYEEDLITKDEFLKRKEELNSRSQQLLEEKQPLLVALSDDTKEQIPYEFIKEVLQNFSKLIASCDDRQKKKTLLHMIISEITINQQREIDSIRLKINDNLIEYIGNQDGVSMKGTPSIFALRNIGIGSIDFDIAI